MPWHMYGRDPWQNIDGASHVVEHGGLFDKLLVGIKFGMSRAYVEGEICHAAGVSGQQRAQARLFRVESKDIHQL